MNWTLLYLAQGLLILLVGGLVVSVLYGVQYVFKKRGTSQQKVKKLLQYITLGLSCWLALLGFLAYLGFFSNFQSLPPRIFLAVFPPILLTIILLTSKSFTALLMDLPAKWLIYIQGFRILMEMILWLGFVGGFVPFQMTFEGLNFDILVGITALMAGYVFFYRGRYLRFEAIIWNISGLTLLLNIVLIAMLSAPYPFRVFMNEPANTFVAHFPFIWIPGFVVPFAFAMHLFSLKQLLLNKKNTRRKFLEGRRRA